MFHVHTAPELHRALVQRAGEEDLLRVPVWRPIVDELHDQPGTFVAQVDQGALSRGVAAGIGVRGGKDLVGLTLLTSFPF
jgi:hypothetical protein